jgi:hypothetical protein
METPIGSKWLKITFESSTLYTAGGVGELYQRRSTLVLNRYIAQITTPSGLGTSDNGW